MALLDVSEVISDPLFTSPVTLIVREESEDEDGQPVWTETDQYEVQAVVTSDMKTLERLPEEIRRVGSIVVRFLVKDAPTFQGRAHDCVVWRGKRFAINDCADYTMFGKGFLRLICSPEEATDGGY